MTIGGLGNAKVDRDFSHLIMSTRSKGVQVLQGAHHHLSHRHLGQVLSLCLQLRFQTTNLEEDINLSLTVARRPHIDHSELLMGMICLLLMACNLKTPRKERRRRRNSADSETR